jgi:dUTP pyrophosphatase
MAVKKKLRIGVLQTPGIELPTFATNGSVGFDLKATSVLKVYSGIREVDEKTREKSLVDGYIVLRPFERALIGTGLFLEIPAGYWIRITAKSGKSLKQGIIVIPGTIDSDYKGEIGIIIQNVSNFLQKIELNKWIAQGIVHKAEQPIFEFIEQQSESQRGDGGFGHTGDYKMVEITEEYVPLDEIGTDTPLEEPKTEQICSGAKTGPMNITITDTIQPPKKGRTAKQRKNDKVMQLANEIANSGAMVTEEQEDGSVKVSLTVVKDETSTKSTNI